jgi:hypothetical protein
MPAQDRVLLHAADAEVVAQLQVALLAAAAGREVVDVFELLVSRQMANARARGRPLRRARGGQGMGRRWRGRVSARGEQALHELWSAARRAGSRAGRCQECRRATTTAPQTPARLPRPLTPATPRARAPTKTEARRPRPQRSARPGPRRPETAPPATPPRPKPAHAERATPSNCEKLYRSHKNGGFDVASACADEQGHGGGEALDRGGGLCAREGDSSRQARGRAWRRRSWGGRCEGGRAGGMGGRVESGEGRKARKCDPFVVRRLCDRGVWTTRRRRRTRT